MTRDECTLPDGKPPSDVCSIDSSAPLDPLVARLGEDCRELPFEPLPFPFSKLEPERPAIHKAAPQTSQNRGPSALCVLHLSQTIIRCFAGCLTLQTKHLSAK